MDSKELFKAARQNYIPSKMDLGNVKRILMLNWAFIRETVDFKYLAAKILVVLLITIYDRWEILLVHSGSHILT